MKRFASIRTRLAAVFLALVLASLFVSAFWGIQQKERARSTQIADLDGKAQLAAAAQRTRLSKVEQLLASTSRHPDVQAAASSPEAESLLATCRAILADVAKQMTGSIGFALWDRQGDLICADSQAERATINVRDRLWFHDTTETNRFSIGEYQVNRTSGEPTLAFGLPVLDSSGSPIAYLSTGLLLSPSEGQQFGQVLPEGSDLSIADLNGRILASEHFEVGHLLSLAPDVLASLAESPAGTFERVDGRAFFVSLAGFPETAPIYAVLSVPSTRIEISYSAALLRYAPLLAVAVMSVCIVWLIADRWVVVPTMALAATIRDTRRESDDPGAEITAGNEIDLLAAEFAAMNRRVDAAITEAKQNEQKFIHIANAVPAAVWTADANGLITFASERWYAFTGLDSSDDSTGWPHMVIHPEDYERCTASWQRALDEGEPYRVEMRTRCGDGVYRWFRVEAVPERNVAGAISTWYGTATEIDDEKRRAEARTLLEDASEAMSRSSGIEELGGALIKVLVPRFTDVVSLTVWQGDQPRRIAHVPERPGWTVNTGEGALSGLLAEVFEHGKARLLEEFTEDDLLSIGGGSQGAESLRRAGLRSALLAPISQEGRTLGVLITASVDPVRRHTFDDLYLLEEIAARAAYTLSQALLIEELRRREEELEASNAAKDEFLSLVSHELRTPITTIMGNAAILAKRIDTLDEEEKAQSLADMKAESERLDRIVQNLLTLARLDTGIQPEQEPVLAYRLVEQVVNEMRRQAPHREFTLTSRRKDLLLYANPAHLQQIVRNYISNAIKYSPEGAPIEVVISGKRDEGVIQVLDRGPGVDEEEIARVFEPFYRSTRNAYHVTGIGIGLAVCRRLAESLGGKVWANPRKGGGSEFGVSLPLFDTVQETDGLRQRVNV